MKKSAFLTIYFLFGFLFLMVSCSTDDSGLPDDTPQTITTDSQLANLLVRTSESSTNPNAISCIDFQYPITFIVYGANNQQTGTQTVNNDAELLVFLSNLDPNGTISIEFPITVILQNGTLLEVNNNQELLDIIIACDSTGEGQIPTNFTEILTNGVWYVTYFFDDTDETSNFSGYTFSFATDNTAQAVNGTTIVHGTWNLTSSSTPDLDLFFGPTSPLDELDEDWDILEVTNEIIRLKHVSGGDGSIDYLTYQRTPNSGGGTGGGASTFGEYLVTDVWYVVLLEDDGNNETCDYVEYTFTFNSNQSVVATSASNSVNGTWAIINSSSGLDLDLNFQITGNDDPFEDLNDDWDVTSFSSTTINLMDISGGNGGTDYLNFGRIPYSDCSGGSGNAQALRDIMANGPWFVANYTEDGNNQSTNYTGYVVTFSSNGTVVASNSSTTINGSWEVTSDSSGLDLVLNFGENPPFDDFNEDWDVTNFTTSLIALIDISGGNGTTDELTFQKL